VRAFVAEATDDGPSSLHFRTHSFLRCEGVSGDELVAFLAAPIDVRRRMYVAWKRREVESGLDADHLICERCRVSFRVYANAWNKAGRCSKACHQAQMKSDGLKR